LKKITAVFLTLFLVITQGCTKKRRGYSFSQIKQMPQFAATVTDIRILDYAEFKDHPKPGESFIIIVGLRTSDSREFSILQTRANSNHAAFAAQLSVGRSYRFPDIIPNFEEQASK